MSDFECRDVKKKEYQGLPGKNSGTRFLRVEEVMRLREKMAGAFDLYRKAEYDDRPMGVDVVHQTQLNHNREAALQGAVQEARRIQMAMRDKYE